MPADGISHGGVAGLLELGHRLSAHGCVDVDVADADDGSEFLQHEEDDAVVDHAAPVAVADQRLLFFREAGHGEEGFLVGAELARHSGFVRLCRNLFRR